MDDTVRLFNSLPRPKTTPTGLPNHWVFGVRHVPLDPPEDVVVAVHPLSRYFLQGGQAQILSASTMSEKAAALVPLLLGAFIKGAETPGGRRPEDPPAFAPWSWATEDAQLAKAVQDVLEQHGVKKELCGVGTCSAKEKEILDGTWSDAYKTLLRLMGRSPEPVESVAAVTPGDGSRCHGCGLSRESFPSALLKCSACSKAFYHSQACQRQHWKEHKPTCFASRPGKPSSSLPKKVDAWTYYNTTARVTPGGQALLRQLRLHVPAPSAAPEGYNIPLTALVYTGQDTPENMQTLFGPGWRTSLGEEHAQTRLNVLLEPPRGSPSFAMNAGMMPQLASLQRSPRPASPAEQREITMVKEMQEAVRRRIGVGKSPGKDDMMAVLREFGAGWAAHLQTYTLAVNTMDQGVRV